MTPDVNVLVAGSRADHPHHGPALAWLDAALEDCEKGRPLAIYPMVAAGFLRLVPPEGLCSADATRRRAGVPARRAEFPRCGDASTWKRMACVRTPVQAPSADRQRHPLCLDRRHRAGPSRSPGEFRQGIPPFPEDERIHFAEALNLRLHVYYAVWASEDGTSSLAPNS